MDKRDMQRGLVSFLNNAIDDVRETFFGVQIAVECGKCGQLVDRKHLDTPCGQHPALEEEDPYQQQATIRWNRDAEKPKPEPQPKPEPRVWRSKEERDRIDSKNIDLFNRGEGDPVKRDDGGYQRQIETRRQSDDFTRRMDSVLDAMAYENPTSSADSITSRQDEVPTYSLGDK